MAVPKQITIRAPSSEVVEKLRALSRARGESMNSTILRVLEDALGVDARRDRLRKAATWSAADAAQLDDSVRLQRTVDDDLWR